MPPDEPEGRRPPREGMPALGDAVDRPWTRRQRLLWRGATAWRWLWARLPEGAAAGRIRLASMIRRLLGAPPAVPRGNPLRPGHMEFWIAAHATPGPGDLAAIQAQIAAFPARPRFVLRLDARGAAPAAVASTCRSSPRSSTRPGSCRCWAPPGGLPGGEARIVPVAGPDAAAWALPAADAATWVMPLAAGDTLFDTALYRLAAAAVAQPELAILYGDECRPDGLHPGAHPWFKPDFDLDRLLGADLFGHAAAFRPGLLPATAPEAEAEGWFAAGLRAALAAGAARIGHVPALLVARPAAAPPPGPAAAAAIVAALAGQGAAVAVEPLPPAATGWRRVVWPLPARPPLVSVVVPTRDRARLVATCAEGVLARTDYPAVEFIVVDNGSTEPATAELFARLGTDPRVRILPAPGPFNYAALNNQAAAAARGEVLLLLNNDIEVMEPGWLRELVSQALRPGVGAVGAKLLYADATLQHGGVVTGVGGVADHYRLGVPREDTGYFGSLATVREVAAATGACLALPRQAFEAVGGLDADNLAVAFNDVDLCLRLRAAGYRILFTPSPSSTIWNPPRAGRMSAPRRPSASPASWPTCGGAGARC
ncbi:glycosyltransferase [Paeniroseomonas aquatica]|uniref:glycosyltransferase n=1 Tax=Paeniroseomonas aquatica TaxID=373043 RepID=UPI0036145CEF